MRAGVLTYLVTNVIGGGVTSFKKSDPARKPDMALLNQILGGMSAAPSPSTVACYGNVALNYIAKGKVNDQRIRNIYATVEAIDHIKSEYDKKVGAYKHAKGRLASTKDFFKALGADDVEEMDKIARKLIKDEAKKPVKKWLKKWTGLDKIPLDRYTFYLTIIRASHAPVKRLSTNETFRAQFTPLMLCETGQSAYPTGPQPSVAPSAPPHLETKNYTVTLTGRDLYQWISDPSVPAEVGGCTVVNTTLNCVGYDRAYANTIYRATAPLRVIPDVQLPAALLADVYDAKVSVQATADFSSISGEAEWQYGDYGTPARATVTGAASQTLEAVPLDTSFDVAYGGGLRAPVKITIPDYSKVSISSLKLTFTYQQMVV